jgi:hypothetical protein
MFSCGFCALPITWATYIKEISRNGSWWKITLLNKEKYVKPLLERKLQNHVLYNTVTHLVTRGGVWIGNWINWTLKIRNYNTIANSNTLQFITASTKSSQAAVSSPVVASQRLLTPKSPQFRFPRHYWPAALSRLIIQGRNFWPLTPTRVWSPLDKAG